MGEKSGWRNLVVLTGAVSNIVVCIYSLCLLKVEMNFPSSDQKVIPKALNDVKLIYAGKVLENTKTIAESRIPIGELPGVVNTMHVVVQPSMERKKTGLLYL